jgi:type 1 fimbria pilin
MRSVSKTLATSGFAMALVLGFAFSAEAAGKRMTITGYVLDSACLFTKNLKKPVSDRCALQCAAGGSPLVILGTDELVYLPIDGKMPATGQNGRLAQYGGKTVKVTGDVYQRGGSNAIVIETIAEVKATAK